MNLFRPNSRKRHDATHNDAKSKVWAKFSTMVMISGACGKGDSGRGISLNGIHQYSIMTCICVRETITWELWEIQWMLWGKPHVGCKKVPKTFSFPTKTTLPNISSNTFHCIIKRDCHRTEKSFGPDGLNPKLCDMAPILAAYISDIFNRSLKSGILAEDQTSTNIDPIFQGDDKNYPANYGPDRPMTVMFKVWNNW